MGQWKRKDAWAGSTRKGRLPVDWERLRAVVLRRCDYRCEWFESGFRCWEPATDADHISPGDDHGLENLQGLCRTHHLKKTAREAYAARQQRKALRRLPEEKQPGIIDGPPQPTEHRGF